MINLSRIKEIDISRQARALAWLRWTNYWLVMGFGSMAIALLIELVSPTAEDDKIVVLIALLIACLGAYIGWRHVGVINPAFWWAYRMIFSLVIAFNVYDIVLMSLAAALVEEGASPSQMFGDQRFSSQDIKARFFWDIINLVLILPGWISLKILRSSTITTLGVTVDQISLRLTNNAGNTVVKATDIRRINKPRGLVIGITGALILVLHILMPLKVLGLLSVLLPIFGFFMLIRARRYFQFDADSLLGVDQRPPILFLRSFSDDEKEVYVKSDKALLDFSLETRLSNHFFRFGPFVAIGSPTETVPQLGAARVHLSDVEWQPQVLTWIRDARLIIMYSGKTHWVTWELQQVVKSERATRLILMIPEVKAWRRSTHNKEISSRIDQAREVFKSSRWEENLLQFVDFKGLRSMLFCPDGSIVVVKSRSRTRDSYHLAALVAHHILIDSDVLNETGKEVTLQTTRHGR